MMRWLKDKKREKRSSSTPSAEDDKEDDYGFEKEKQASRSPPSRRQLPPTPAAPEEKSPHIYEEIPDLPLCCTPEGEKALLQSKFNKGKASGRKSPQNRKSQGNQGGNKYEAGDINPYMVVPVDKDVRQTPTDFHRNGTPEVHCDVIVKDTHCEILMTRKPKVSAFRLDTTAFSGERGGVGGVENNGGTSGVRNNTHFCSRDRRASVDVHSSGKPNAFGYSAFSGSSRTTVSGQQSSQSMSNFQEVQGQEAQENCDTSASGVVPYACASNFIPRTKLTFHPLGGKDPRKEAFGSDCSDDSQTVNMCRMRDDAASSGTNGVSYSSIQDVCNTSKSVTYTSVVEQNTSGASIVGKFDLTSEKQPCYRYGDSQSSFKNSQCYGDSNVSRGGIIRPTSPSNSSSCTYASVNFPVDPKVYNTIPDLIPPDFRENSAIDSSVIYASVQETFDSQQTVVQKNTNDTHIKNGSGYDRAPYGGANARLPTQFNSGFSREVNQSVPKGSTDQGAVSPPHSIMSSEAHYRRSLDLDFCSCSDEHSSSCGCIDSKNGQDDDECSVAGAASIGPGSCKGCGRLIRQITYSESFSDETYEHAYSSRLLIRSGRRSNAAELLAFRETLTTELQSTSHARSPDFLMAMSRDDTWALSRSDDTLPPAYGACDDNGFVSNYGESMSLKRRDSDMSAYRIFRDSKGLSVGSVSSPKHFMRQNTSPVSSDTSMFCSLRATVSTSSFFSTRRQGLLDHMDTLPQTEESIPHRECLDSAPSISNSASEQLAFPKAPPSFTEPATFSKVPPTYESQVKEPNIENFKAILQGSGQGDTKPNTFSGIFSKFGRSKSSKTQKSDSSETCLSANSTTGQMNDRENRLGDLASKEDSGDKNVKKLSKFFQRLSSKECVRPANNTAQVCFRLEANGDEPETMATSSKMTKPATSSQLFSDEGGKEKTDLKNILLSRHSDVALSSWVPSECQASGGQMHKVVSQTKLSSHCSPEIHGLAAIASDVQREVTRGACTGAFDALAAGKPQAANNTDSGDTCYEYDISTSSEGEQASYDYFLSKVKKTLNLEREVQHMADSGALRKRLLCKSCKKDEQLSTVETVEAGASGSSYWFCPHLSAKFGDLRAILADLVVDQRAAILDCLTDYAQSPYGVRSGAVDGHQCDCGFEALTTDAESLATIYNLLSHPLNYPSGQTPSCDSDEGTMADNSCESADEAIGVNKTNCATPRVENVENEQQQAPLRTRKKEKKDKKGVMHPVDTFSKETVIEKMKFTEGHGNSKEAHQTYSEINSTPSSKQNTSVSASVRRNAGKKTSVNIASFVHNYNSLPSPELSCDRPEHSKCCLVSKSKHTIVTDKAIQDIYSPLPSKALSILTSRNYGPPAGASNCTCGGGGGRGFYAPLKPKAAQLATGELSPPPPPTAEYETVNPSPACSRLCDANNGTDEVPSVQTHLGREDAKSCSGELHQHNGEKDGSGEQRKLSASAENKIAVHGVKEPPMESINACIKGSEAKDGHFQITKHGAPVSGQDKGCPSIINASLKNRPRFYVDVPTSDGRETCSQGIFNAAAARVPASRERKGLKQAESNRLEIDVAANSNAIIAQAVETNMRAKLSRKQRLELATLDLLPETALCGDADPDAIEGCYHHNDGARHCKPKISKVVEEMTKIFEGHGDDLQMDQRKHNRQSGSKMWTHDRRATDEGSQKRGTSRAAKGNDYKDVSSQMESVGSEPTLYRDSESSRHLNQRDRKLQASAQLAAALSDAAKNKRKRDLRIAPSSCEIEESETTSACDREKSNSATSVGDGTVDQKPSLSPRLSSPSSGSPTASLSKKKAASGGKHRKLNKKSSHKRRSRSRSERGKGGSSKGEKTLYYLSSDLSDIDVVEVDDWETYAKTKAPQRPGEAGCNSRPEASIYDDITSPEAEGGLNGSQDAEGGSHQEVYALPPSSAELRSARAQQQGGLSNNSGAGGGVGGEQSPEPPRPRKGLRTDVYRTVKNNNKLLSDVIIRNYDMQVYGNV